MSPSELESKKSRRTFHRIRRRGERRGAAAVEVAITFPIFLLFLFTIIEFGHLLMVKAALTSAAKDAARLGSVSEASTAEVEAFIQDRMSSLFPTVNPIIRIKDASIYDGPNPPNGTIDCATLPDIELATAQPRQMFAVELRVNYASIAIFPPFWAQNTQLVGLSVTRHE